MQRLLLRARSLFLTLLFLAPAFGLPADSEKLFYGFETGGALMGYVEVTFTTPDEPAAPRRIHTEMFAKMSLLGQDFDLRVDQEHWLDRETGRVIRYEGTTEQGASRVAATMVIENGVARFTTSEGMDSSVAIDDDVQRWDGFHFPRALGDLASPGATKTYRSLDYNDGTIHDVTYTRGKDEVLTLEGVEYPCSRFTGRDGQTGVAGDMWIDAGGRMFRATLPNGSIIERASPAVVGKIKRAELDDLLLARVNVAIADVQGIEYMKVRARVKTVGEVVTPESLNVPGQKFTGTVTDNLVEGVFELTAPRYDGTGAPAFPPDFTADPALAVHLAPGMMIESDDPVLVAMAHEITAGAEDAWVAARRLSKWVADEIVYEIPGGSARRTFDSRRGECGSHARLLTAFCRGVGIPARLACGGMYTPNYGGSFGQHAWTEVYMGPAAGWIPVDATAHEIDYVDAGHIRLGSLASFFPEELEVLDHRLRAQEGITAAKVGSFVELPWELGVTYTYTYTQGGKRLATDSFTILDRTEEREDVVWTYDTKFVMGTREVVGTVQMNGAGRPLAYHLDGKAGTIEYTVDCEFTDEHVVEKAVQAGRPMERTVPLPAEVYLLDNNNFSGYAMLLAGIPLTPGTGITLRAFHPTSMQLLPVRITVGAKETIAVGGVEVDCTVCELNIAGTPLRLWVDARGRIRRETEGGGRLVVELEGGGIGAWRRNCA